VPHTPSEPAAAPTRPFDAFWERHRELNRFLRSTDFACELARNVAAEAGAAPEAPFTALFSPSWPLDEKSVKSYWSPLEERPPNPTRIASVAEFAADLAEVRRLLTRSVVILYLGAFETFLAGWLTEATGKPRSRSHNPTLRHLAKCYPWLHERLHRAAHVFTDPEGACRTRPVEPRLNCFDVSQMWREIRNLFVHAQGCVSRRFLEQHGPTWQAVCAHAGTSRGELREGDELLLGIRETVFCFTTTFKTAGLMTQALAEWDAERR
jgi:hypothetical protein